MNMRSSHNPEFAIDSSDLEAVISLLSDQTLMTADDHHIRDLIIDDLMKLPSTNIGPFSITCLSRFTCDDPELGSGSEWVSMDADDEGMNFSIGNRIYTPGVGGDTSSETIFECRRGGDTEGHLVDWLSQLESLDRDLMKITVSHEGGEIACADDPSPNATEPETSSRDKLTRVYEKAVNDPQLSPEMRVEANRHYRNLMAIKRLKGTDSNEDYVVQVRSDHFAHKFAIVAVAAFGWQLHGWLVGLGVLVGLVIVISITNIAVMAVGADKSVFRLLRINRWSWVVFAAIALALSGATVAAT